MSARQGAERHELFLPELVEEGAQLVQEFKAVDTGAVVVAPFETERVISHGLDLQKLQILPTLE